MKNTVLQNKSLLIGILFWFAIGGYLHAQSPGDSYSSLYNEAIRKIDKKQYQDARELLNQAIALKADYAEAIFVRGTCNLMLKEWDQACNDFEKSSALRWKPSEEYILKYCGDNSYGRKANRKNKK